MPEDLGSIDIRIIDDVAGTAARGATAGAAGGAASGVGVGGTLAASAAANRLAFTSLSAFAGPAAIAGPFAVAAVSVNLLRDAVSKSVRTLRQWSDNLGREADRLSFLNPTLAGASATAQLGQFVRDFQRANALQGGLSNLVALRELRANQTQGFRNFISAQQIRAVTAFEKALNLGIGTIDDFLGGVNAATDPLFALGGAATFLATVFGAIRGETDDRIALILSAVRAQLKTQNDLKRLLSQFAVEQSNAFMLRDIEQLSAGAFRSPVPFDPAGFGPIFRRMDPAFNAQSRPPV